MPADRELETVVLGRPRSDNGIAFVWQEVRNREFAWVRRWDAVEAVIKPQSQEAIDALVEKVRTILKRAYLQAPGQLPYEAQARAVLSAAGLLPDETEER